MATGAWICSHGPPPFQMEGRSYPFSIPGKMMMFTGALLSMTGLIAVIEAKDLSRIAAISLVHSLCGVLILESVAGSMGLALSFSVSRGFLNESLSRDLLDEYALTPHVTHYWNKLQKKLRCCGLVRPEDWRESHWWRHKKEMNMSQPGSCCVGKRALCDEDNIYKEGCGDVSSRLLYNSLVRLYICAFVNVLIHTSSYLVLFFLQGKV